MSRMDDLLDRFSPAIEKIATEVHLIAIRDALLTVVPFLVLGGFATFFANVLFTETSPLASVVGAQALSDWSSMFMRINAGTMGLLGLLLAALIPYFMGIARNFENPVILAVTGLSCFFIFQPLGGEGYQFGTNGIMLAILLGLGSSALFMRLSRVERLKWDLGDSVPEMVSRSFSLLFIIVLTVAVFGLIAAAVNLLTGMETVEFVYSVLQRPFIGFGASIPGMEIYSLLTSFFQNFLGIQSSAITAPISTAMIAAVDTGEIVNYSFYYTFCQFGGGGCMLGVTVYLFFFARRQEWRALGKMAIFPSLFNISEPIIFGLPTVLNPVFFIPSFLVMTVNGLIAYAATALGFIPVLSNTVTWSMPVFIKGFVASNGDLRVCALEAVLLVLSIVIWGVFLRFYERYLDRKDAEAAEQIEAAKA